MTSSFLLFCTIFIYKTVLISGVGGVKGSFPKIGMLRELSNNNTVPSFARGINILVVDYDTTSLMYLASLLEQNSYNVTTTELPTIALSMIREDNARFKLVMANVNMLDMDCLSFLHWVLKKDIPVILMASQRNLNFAQRALAEGASFYMEKPISPDDLKYLWQHVYKTGKHMIEKISSGKDDGEILINHAKTSDHQSANNSLQTPSVLVEAASVRRRSSLTSTFTEHYYSQETYKQAAAAGGRLGNTKRTLMMDDDDDLKEKKIKLKGHFEYRNSSVVAKPSKGIIANNERNKTDNISDEKKNRRILWSPELHLKFTAAISKLGDRRARPKLILQTMKVPNLTERQVASHLQKYRAQVQRISETSTNIVPTVVSTPFGRRRTTAQPSSKAFEKIKSLTSQPGHKHFVIPGMTQAADIIPEKYNLGSSGNVFNAGNSVAAFTLGKSSLEVNFKADLAPQADPAPLASPVDQKMEPSTDYADLIKLLEEDQEEEFKDLAAGSEPDPSDVDGYCRWLTNALFDDKNDQPWVEPQLEEFNL